MRKAYLIIISLLIYSYVIGQHNFKSYFISDNKSSNKSELRSQTKGDLPCTNGNLFSNPYEDRYGAYPSEESIGITRATQFSTIGGEIETITVWGINGVNNGNGWSVCNDNDLTFDIIFFEDINDTVGDTIAFFNDQTVTRITTNEMLFESYPVYEYTFQLPSPVSVSEGFVAFRASNDGSCWFMWINTSSGFGVGKSFNDTVWTEATAPFTICMGGTESNCTAPTDILTSNADTSSINISWVNSGDNSNWNIEYGVKGFEQGNGITISATETNYTLTNLEIGTEYDFYIQSDCGSGNTSIWKGPYSFATFNCALTEKCGYPVIFADTYGDGWNGASLSIFENGVEVFHTNGSECINTEPGYISYSDTVYLCSDFNIDIVFNSGSADSEIQFSLKRPFTGYEFTETDASNLNSGIVHSFVSNCEPYDAEAELVAINPIYNNCELGMTDITVFVANNSASSMSNFELSYRINDLSNYVTEIVTEVVPAWDTLEYTFNNQADLTHDGEILLTAYVNLVGDQDHSNDSSTFEVINVSSVSPPYSCGFDSNNALLGWTKDNTNNDETTWLIGQGIGVNNSTAMVYQYSVSNSADDWLFSTCLDLNGGQEYQISFEYAVHASEYPEKLEVFYGNSQNVESMNHLIADLGELHNEEYNTATYTFTPPSDDTYYVGFHAYSDAYMYLLKIDNFNIDFSTSNKSFIQNEEVKLYPNPAKDLIIIEATDDVKINIYNVLGKQIYSENHSSKARIDVSSFIPGTYFVKIKANEKTTVKKINIIN